MERVVYDRMAELDSRHWWYRARREILATLIKREIRLPESARILEIGCGTGHNFGMLGRFGRVDGIEIDSAARAIASSRSEEHTSELQSLMRISYAGFCLKKKHNKSPQQTTK